MTARVERSGTEVVAVERGGIAAGGLNNGVVLVVLLRFGEKVEFARKGI